MVSLIKCLTISMALTGDLQTDRQSCYYIIVLDISPPICLKGGPAMVDLQASLRAEAGRAPADVFFFISQFENNQTGGCRSKSVGGGHCGPDSARLRQQPDTWGVLMIRCRWSPLPFSQATLQHPLKSRKRRLNPSAPSIFLKIKNKPPGQKRL